MNGLPLWLDALIAALLVAGAGFAVVGAYGLAKLGDFTKRLHGPTKAATLGVGTTLLAALLWFLPDQREPLGREFLIALFVFITAPIGAHLMIKAAIRLDPGARPPPPPRLAPRGGRGSQPAAPPE